MGLVQREIEAAGITTIALSNIPELTAAVSVPRLAGIERPFGMTVGQPGDAVGQLMVLRTTLEALRQMTTPGSTIELPYACPELPKSVKLHPSPPPPIGRYLFRHPWLYPRLLKRDIPDQV